MLRTAQTLLFTIVLLLVIFGICMLYSTTYAAFGTSLLKKQLTWVFLGAVVATVLWHLDYRDLCRGSWILLVLVCIPLVYLAIASILHAIPGAPRDFVAALPFIPGMRNGGFRWVACGGISFQPSEMAKPLLILYLASYFGRKAHRIHELWLGFLRPSIVGGIVVALVVVGRDLSTAVILAAVIYALLFVGGVRLRYLGPVAIAVTAAVLFLQHHADALGAERASRLQYGAVFRDLDFQNPQDNFQLRRSLLALGSGGLSGRGLTSSIMKHDYLPESHTDFIVAIVGEELGYIALVALLFGYSGLMATAFWIGRLAPDRQGHLMAMGLGLSLGLHGLVNPSVVSGFCPTTGVTAPFLSYGGSSMLSSLFSVGLLLSICRTGQKVEADADADAGGMPPARPIEVTAGSRRRQLGDQAHDG